MLAFDIRLYKATLSINIKMWYTDIYSVRLDDLRTCHIVDSHPRSLPQNNCNFQTSTQTNS